MLCSNPVNIGGDIGLVGCGQCIACRINKRREWTHRILLEASLYKDNTFVTLSYDDPSIPRVDLYHTNLVPKHLQDWLKRFRKFIEPHKVRYYAAGEYGDDTERAHFHLALFNFPNCFRGTTYGGDFKRIYSDHPPGKTYCCSICDAVYRTWGKGAVVLGSLSESSAQYIAGYVMKKMTRPDDLRLVTHVGVNRHPEFTRMSNRPGIGHDAMHDVASVVLEFDLVESQGDVPSALRHGKRLMPLGRYLRKKLRLLATGTEEAPEVSKEYYREETARLRALQHSSPASEGPVSLIETKLKEDLGKLRNKEGRYNLFKQKRKL